MIPHPQPQHMNPQPISVEVQIAGLAKDIETIRDTHLAHMAEDIDNVNAALAETKAEFNQRFDRLDDRLWVLVGLTASTLLTILLAALFGA